MTVADDRSKEMNAGVALLLERMKTNPEEFVSEYGSSKWGSLISAHKEFLDPEDRQALETEHNKILQQSFTEKVLQELVDPKSRDGVTILNINYSNATAMANTTLATPYGPFANSITNQALLTKLTVPPYANTTTLNNVGVGSITTLEEIKKEYETEKKPTTIFGRLFNYQ